MWYARSAHSCDVSGRRTNTGSVRSCTVMMTRSASITRQSPPRNCVPRGSDVPNSTPPSDRRRPRIFSRSSQPSVIVSRVYTRLAGGRSASRQVRSATGTLLKTGSISRRLAESEQKIPLRQREHVGRVAHQQRAVGAHLVGLGVHFDARQRVVQPEI